MKQDNRLLPTEDELPEWAASDPPREWLALARSTIDEVLQRNEAHSSPTKGGAGASYPAGKG